MSFDVYKFSEDSYKQEFETAHRIVTSLAFPFSMLHTMLVAFAYMLLNYDLSNISLTMGTLCLRGVLDIAFILLSLGLAIVLGIGLYYLLKAASGYIYNVLSLKACHTFYDNAKKIYKQEKKDDEDATSLAGQELAKKLESEYAKAAKSSDKNTADKRQCVHKLYTAIRCAYVLCAFVAVLYILVHHAYS